MYHGNRKANPETCLLIVLVLAIASTPIAAPAAETLTREQVLGMVAAQFEEIEDSIKSDVPSITRRLLLVGLVKDAQRRSGEITWQEAESLLDGLPAPGWVQSVNEDMITLQQYLEGSPPQETVAVHAHLEKVTRSLRSRWTTYFEKSDEVLKRAERKLGIRYAESNQSSSAGDEAQ